MESLSISANKQPPIQSKVVGCDATRNNGKKSVNKKQTQTQDADPSARVCACVGIDLPLDGLSCRSSRAGRHKVRRQPTMNRICE